MSGRVALGAILVVAGVIWLLSATGALDLSYGTWIGVLLVLIGLAIALIPGRHGGLVLLGILVALAGLPALVVDEDVFRGGVGDELETPTSRADLEPYRHGIGKLTVDLTSPDLDLDGATVEASIGIGELVVVVPDDADVELDVHVGIGNVEALGRSESGVDVDVVGLSGTSGRQELALELEAGIGDVRVERGV
jgi:predicted membrane protein